MICKQHWFNSPLAVIITLALGLIIRTIIAFYLYPGYDEAYYYLYSQNLDWSYFDHPLLVALTTGLGVWVTGEVNQFTIRIGTLMIFTLSLYLLYLTGKKLFNHRSGLFTLIITSLIPIFTIAFGVLTLPDVPLIFFWTLSLWLAVDEFFCHSPPEKYQPSYRLIFICISLGLTCLSKYHGFILGLGLIGFCLFNKPYRRVFSSEWMFWGVISFLLTLVPLLYWNWQHDWISFTFQLSGRFQSPEKTSLSINPLQIIVVALMGIGYLFPSFGFPLWWVSGKTMWREVVVNQPNYPNRLILWVSLPLTFGFTLLGAVASILPTWAMPGFWGLSLILGNYLSRSNISRQLIRRWFLFSALVIQTIFLIGLLHLNLGILQKPNQNIFSPGMISPEKDPSTELIDIMQLRSSLESSSIFIQALENADFVFTNQYFLGGYIGMAIAPLTNLPITCFGYDSRGFLYWYPVEKLIGKQGLYITSKSFAQDKYSDHDYSPYFTNWREITQIPLKRSGEITEIFYVYQGENLTQIPPQTDPNYLLD